MELKKQNLHMEKIFPVTSSQLVLDEDFIIPKSAVDDAKYFVSGGYYQTDGVFKENPDPNAKYDSNFGFERFSLRSNVDLKVTKTTQLSIDLAGQYTNRLTANRSADDIFSFMLHTPPYIFPAIYSDGTLSSYEKQADSNNRNPYNMLYNQGYRKEYGTKVSKIYAKMPDVSSTEVRNRLKSGLDADDLLPDEVERYIKENGLYQD